MARWVKINADEVVPFQCGEVYDSKLLTGSEMAGQSVININEGTLKPFARTGGAAHENTEIYYMVDVSEGSFVVLGEGAEEKRVPVRNGDIIVIPGGTFHWIDNLNCNKPFVLFTFWPDEKQNSVYFKRMQAWGTSMRYLQNKEGGK